MNDGYGSAEYVPCDGGRLAEGLADMAKAVSDATGLEVGVRSANGAFWVVIVRPDSLNPVRNGPMTGEACFWALHGICWGAVGVAELLLDD